MSRLKTDAIRNTSASADALTFDTNGNTTVGGKVLVGATTEGHVSADDLTVETAGHTGITIRSGTSNQGSMYFSDATSGAAEYAGWIRYDHSGNNLTLGTNETERIRIQSSGGISFNGDTAVANALDDYEEGTFQPSWSSTGVGLTFTYNSDHRHGFYTKIGNLVTFNLYISSIAAPSGDATNPLYISGLPYSASNTTGNSAALTIGFYYNITAGTDEVFPLAYINKNTSQITLTWSRRNSDVNQQMISSDLTDYTWLTVAGSYRV